MSVTLLTILFFGVLLIALVLGLPLSFTLGGVSMVFLYFTWGPESYYMVVAQTWGNMNKFTIIAIPLFVFMAMLLERSGVARDLYEMMYLWFGGVGGGLAIGTVIICAIFSAMCGISGAAVVTMGTIALPSMMKYNYDTDLALGCINAGGGWGVLIPPSVMMILYSLISGVSVGRMFAGGVFPGLVLLILVSAYIAIRCAINPKLGPPLPKEQRGDWDRKLKALKGVILPIGIVIMVLGSIMGGVTTPTEAAAIGLFGSMVATFYHRQLSWKVVKEAATNTMRTTGMIMWILFGAYSFASAYHAMGASEFIQELMMMLPGGKWGALLFMQAVLFILAMLMDPAGIMMICVPVFLPIIKLHGFDPLWFGILFIINMEIGYSTPPFGFNLFYLKSIVPPSITMKDIYRSVIYYTVVETVGLIIVMLFPAIATWLPYALLGKP